jgi:Fe2+ transport system protein FeoA
VTASAIAPAAAGGASPPVPVCLTTTVPGRAYVVVAVHGDDQLARRLIASGLWVGARFERLGQAPFGDPLLFRLHGFRLALRAREAARVRVVEVS